MRKAISKRGKQMKKTNKQTNKPHQIKQWIRTKDREKGVCVDVWFYNDGHIEMDLWNIKNHDVVEHKRYSVTEK